MTDNTTDEESSAFVDRWRSQLIDLEPELQAIHTNRILFRELVEAIETKSPETPAIWRSHYASVYAASQMMGLRRIVIGRRERGHLSLTTILLEIEQQPRAFTVERYLEPARRYSEEYLDLHRERFLSDWGDGGGGIDPGKPRAHRSELIALTRAVLAWADRTIAHQYPREERPATVTYGDLDRAIDDVTATYNRYRELLTGTHIAFDLTAIDPAWATTFDRPLFPRNRLPRGEEPTAG